MPSQQSTTFPKPLPMLLYWMLFIVLLDRSCQGMTEKPHREAVMNLVNTYANEHSANALKRELSESSDQLCNRKFVTNIAFPLGCSSLGNTVGSFLNSLVYALALNRTIFLTHSNNLNTGCSGYMTLKDWVISRVDLKSILKKAGCPLTENTVDFWDFPPCGYAESSARVITGDGLFNPASFTLKDGYDPSISTFVKNRARMLFGSHFGDNSRFEVFGVMMIKAFGFSPELKNFTRAITRNTHSLPNSFRVSLHLRHRDEKSVQDPSVDVPLDNLGVQALTNIVNLHRNSKCIIYLATDRNTSIDRVLHHSKELGCVVHMANRAENPAVIDAYAEHGPWALGILQVADIYLLGHGDYFIGTWESSYSILIANLVSASSLLKNSSGNPIFWVKKTGEILSSVDNQNIEISCKNGRLK